MVEIKLVKLFSKNWTKTLSVFFFVLLLGAYAYTFAVPPDTKYSAGETLDPNCGPLDPNCSVELTTTESDPIVGAINGLIKADGSGNISAVASGTDIKTINGSSILGSGDITVSGGGSMVYPGSGIAVSTGTAWGTSISGTSSQFVKADGSLDSNTYVTGTPWTSMGYITDGNTGWDNSYGFITSYTETDPIVGAINGLVKANGGGTISAVVSGTDIKTINGSSILGSGNITISGGGSMVYPGSGIAVSTGTAWGTSISGTSSQFVKADGSLDSNTYLTSSSLSGYVPYTGATGAVTLGANTLSTTSGLISPKLYPASDSTTAIQFNKADGTTNVMNIDTTNGYVGIGTTSPTAMLDIKLSPTIIFSQVFYEDDKGDDSLNDATFSGTYTGASDDSIYVQIDSTGSPDTFSYSDNLGDCPEVSNVPITGSVQSLCLGMSIQFTNITGHSISDVWGYESHEGLAEPIKISDLDDNVYFRFIPSQDTKTEDALAIGYQAGPSNVRNVRGSYFLGYQAGYGAESAHYVNFLGSQSGYQATNAPGSNFLGYQAGYQAINAETSNFIGVMAGSGATNATSSNFFGINTGQGAIDASYSNFFGDSAGSRAEKASNSIFIGTSAGFGDTVDNTTNGLSSILIGSFTNTDGHSNSILLGSGTSDAIISNTKANQFMLADSITDVRWGGVEYTLPSSQGSSGQVLTNDGSGGLSWSTVSGGGGVVVDVLNNSVYTETLGSPNVRGSILLGYNAGAGLDLENTDYSGSNFIGYEAGAGATGAGDSNFIGYHSGGAAAGAFNSNFIGYRAGDHAYYASNSIFIGQSAGMSDPVDNTTNGLSSILIGSFTNTDGHSNSILLGSGTFGSTISNTKANQFMLAPTITEMRLRGVDYTLPSSQGSSGQVLTNDGSGGLSWSTVSGGSGGLVSDVDYNTLGGTDAGFNLDSGAQYNTFLGYQTGRSDPSSNNAADYNTAIGSQSLYSNTTGNNNSVIGYQSLYLNTTGFQNSTLGVSSLHNNTTGSYNSAVGYQSLYSNTTANYNSAFGTMSLYSNTEGNSNTAIGISSLYSNITGSSNSALGHGSLYYNTEGHKNSAVGESSLGSNITGSSNSAVGYESLYSNTTGNYNSALGLYAGRYTIDSMIGNATGNNSVFVGYDTRAHADGETNQIVIGANAVGNGSNTATIGDTNLLRTYLTGVNLKAGTATAGTAPLKFTAGTNLTTTEAGAIEYDGSHLYFTATNGGTRYQLDQQGGGGLLSDADFNTVGGTEAGLNLVSGAQYNTFLGYQAGRYGASSTMAAYGNTAIGYKTLYSNTTGNSNSALGLNSLYSNTTGNNNSALGSQSLSFNTTGNNNSALGSSSLFSNTTGNSNSALGYGSLYSNKTGSNGVAIGIESQYYANNTTTPWENYNTSVGYESLMGSTTAANNTGNYNTAIGYQSLLVNTTGGNNTANGYQSLYSNKNGLGNTANGYQSLYTNTGGGGNTANGYAALYSNSSGINNTANGAQSMFFNTTGSYNVASGNMSLYFNTVGENNTSIGSSSLNTSMVGSNGVAVGYESQGYANSTSTPWTNYNTSVGYQSLRGSTTTTDNTGNYNTAIGYKTLYLNSTGGNNSALGYSSLSNNTTGSNNIGIGYQAGMYVNASASPNQTSSNSIYIGYNTQALLDGDTNEIVIGHDVAGHGSNTAQWGSTSITNHYLSGNVQFSTYGAGTLTTDASGNITASSDERLKDIQGNFDNNGNALDIINSINPILYKWNDKSGFDQTTIYAGFSAQNIQDVIPEAVDTDSRGYLTLSDRPILATTVNAIKELDLKVKEFIEADVTDSNSVKSMFKSFLEDFTNGLEIVFFGEVHTKKLCIDDVCIDKAQLEQLLINSGMTSSGSDSKSTSDTSGDADTGADNSVDNDTEDGAQADAGVQDGAEAVDGDSAMGENGGTTQEEITANDESGTAEEEAGGGEQGGTDTGTVVENN